MNVKGARSGWASAGPCEFVDNTKVYPKTGQVLNTHVCRRALPQHEAVSGEMQNDLKCCSAPEQQRQKSQNVAKGRSAHEKNYTKKTAFLAKGCFGSQKRPVK